MRLACNFMTLHIPLSNGLHTGLACKLLSKEDCMQVMCKHILKGTFIGNACNLNGVCINPYPKKASIESYAKSLKGSFNGGCVNPWQGVVYKTLCKETSTGCRCANPSEEKACMGACNHIL